MHRKKWYAQKEVSGRGGGGDPIVEQRILCSETQPPSPPRVVD